MVYFNNDYSEGCIPEILDSLVKLNMQQTSGYGMDEQGRIEKPSRSFVKQPAQSFANPYVKKTTTIQQPAGGSAPTEAFQVGDAVQHKKFGLGTVLDVKWVNADYQVKVNFAKVGEKMLFAKLAGLKKV